MKRTLILGWACLAAARLCALPCKTVLAYYTDWAKYGPAAYSASKIPFAKLSHICHAFVLPNADGTLSVDAAYLEPALISGAHASGVKVLSSIGGSSASADANFRSIAASPALRSAFASNLKSFLIANGYDGADIDWEFPGSAADKANFTLMMAALRAAFNAAPAHPEFLISGAFSWTTYYAQWYDLPGLNASLDFFNVMTYDYHGTWSSHAGHNAPLGGSAGDPDGPLSTKDAVTYFTSRGVPASKFNFGLPFYGYEFPVPALFSSCPGGNCSAGSSRTYADIQALVGNGWTRSWDAAASSPWLSNGAAVISYDDPQSIQIKSDWALNTRGLGGVFMWDLSNDYLGPHTQPLLDAMTAPISCAPPTPTPTVTATFTPQPVPGRIEAENYYRFYDTSPGNSGAQYRSDDVDIEACSDAGGGYDVGWIDAGDWLEYDIQVASPGLYDFSYRLASAGSGAMNFQPQLDGANLGAPVSVAPTGGWQNWVSITLSGLSLSAGKHTLRLSFTAGGYNLNYLDVERGATPTVTMTSTQTWTPVPPGSTRTDTPAPSPTASDSPTASPAPSATPSRSPQATVSCTPTHTQTQVLTPTQTPEPQLPLKIEKALPVPNPNPVGISVKLSTRAERLELRIYSPGSSLIRSWNAGPLEPVWTLVPLPPEFLKGASNGIYFYVIQATSASGPKSAPVKSCFGIFR